MNEKPIRREITELWAETYGADAGPWLRRLADRLAEPDRGDPPHRVEPGDPDGVPHWSPGCWCWRD